MSDKSIEQELLELKTRIDNLELEKAKAQGELTSQINRMKVDFNCASIEEAKIYIEELKMERDKLKQQLMDGIMGIKQQLQMGG
jgi:ribosomal protein L29